MTKNLLVNVVWHRGFAGVHNHQNTKAVMKQLIVTNSTNSPIGTVTRILGNWGKLANDVEERTNLRDGFYLEWRVAITVDHSTGRGWLGVCSVTMGILANTFLDPDGLETTKVFVPITIVRGITIYESGYHWYGDNYDKMTENISVALTKGELPSGHHFEANSFSRKWLNRE